MLLVACYKQHGTIHDATIEGNCCMLQSRIVYGGLNSPECHYYNETYWGTFNEECGQLLYILINHHYFKALQLPLPLLVQCLPLNYITIC